ncbi:hypothetical protein FBU30_010989 [Linnemannia zychae]|nr:hypothetical protein FBU30_010989 [Linnemannia zychae]
MATTDVPTLTTPSLTEINAITPGSIFQDDLLPSFLDTDSSSSTSYDTHNAPPPLSANKNDVTGGHMGEIEVNSTIQTVLVTLGFCVLALFLLGVVAMYYITHKNRRAEEKKRRREDETGSSGPNNDVSISSSTHPSNNNTEKGTSEEGGGGGGLEHRILITRSMTATTAHTRINEKDGGGSSSGGISPIGDGKSDLVTIFIDETPEDEIRVRHHHGEDFDEDEIGNEKKMQQGNYGDKEDLDQDTAEDKEKSLQKPYCKLYP